MKQRYIKICALLMSAAITAGSFSACGSKETETMGAADKLTAAPSTTTAETSLSSQAEPGSAVTSPVPETTTTAADPAANEISRDNKVYEGAEACMDTEAAAPMMVYPDVNTEEYTVLGENGMINTRNQPVSTFSTDVDTASYANTRRLLKACSFVPESAVRAEEFINYFSYDYAQPEGDAPIALTTELSDCPWNDKAKLLMVGVQAQEQKLEKRLPMNIVLLIDVSGSMASIDKLPLVKQSVKMLTERLDENDRISIVTYSGAEKVVLDSAKGTDRELVERSLDELTAYGGTAGEAGINMAYALAEKNFIEGGNNRIVMATDGDLNVGLSSVEELTELIEKKREGGVFLSVLGFGTGNLKDNRLEALADNGNGNYSYIDCIEEAEKVLGTELASTLVTVAKDVKAQVEFDPAAVESYRLVGYENRMLSEEDFTDDTKDAGDMGAGHSSTALYEVILTDGGMESDKSDALMTVKLRYKLPDSDTSSEIASTVRSGDYRSQPSPNLAFASAAAEFAMYLRGSEFSTLTPAQIKESVNSSGIITDKYREGFVELLTLAESIYKYRPDDRPVDIIEIE